MKIRKVGRARFHLKRELLVLVLHSQWEHHSATGQREDSHFVNIYW